ncbi:hypothetical protein AD945_03120 [Gluconobacter albidus]|uniref:Uncharacterized protein n=1 Tax=Gluconobacter albidus TaxID=318683 RepID=A0A149TM03_9PROT|nr:hypothetical protein [Gluconobacter albidus]KXV49946.1 hypothetical protein AD945_03120 [Gluconobacter albidus]
MTSDPFFLQPGLDRASRPGADGSEGSFTCSCCGLPSPGAGLPWTGPSRAGLRVCRVCNLLQDTTRAAIDSEAVLIWWPEITQARILYLARTAHQAIRILANPRQGEPDEKLWTTALSSLDEPILGTQLPATFTAPLNLLRLLAVRRQEAAYRLQSSSIRQVTTALRLCRATDPNVARNLATLRKGLRLLPTGHLLDSGRDVYPAYLDRILSLSHS